MADQKGQSDVFTVVSVLTLLFMILGIAAAIIQWRDYARPPKQPDARPARVDRPELVKSASEAEKEKGEGELEAENRDSGGPGSGDTGGAGEKKKDTPPTFDPGLD